jgi:MFS family permease
MAALVSERRVDDVVVVPAPTPEARKAFPWIVFALTFGLLLSDYMSRQVLSSVFPFLKVEWALTDTQLGALTSVVALTVGLLAVPLSLLGDRWGRSRSIVLMGSIWSLATLGSAISASYGELLLSRLFIGVGEAAYGSVGLAVVLAVFPAYRRASFTGAFMAGGSFGSVLGVALGGALAVHFGWRWSFGAMAILGLVLVVLYRTLVSDKKLDAARVGDVAVGEPVGKRGERAKLRTLFSTPSVVFAYLSSGLQLFIAGSLFAWLPSYLGRAYGLAQLLLLVVGIFFAAGTTGAAGAMVSNLTHESIRATAFGTLTLANNLLGLAAGPLVTGILADRLGLANAMQIVPLAAVGTLVFLLLGRRAYPASLAKVSATVASR